MAKSKGPKRNPARGKTIPKETVDRVQRGQAFPLGLDQNVRNAIAGADETYMGPGHPLVPTAPKETSSRILDYEFWQNVDIRPRSHEAITFEQLRQLADGFDILRGIIETRKDQVSGISWEIRRVREQGETTAAQMKRTAEDPQTQVLTAFFKKPNRYHSWSQWIRALCEDIFVIDAPSILVQRTRGGEVYALHVADGSTFTRKITGEGLTPQPPDVAYQQVIKGMPWVDLDTNQLIYRPRNVRAHKIYGYSPVEQAIMTINIALRREIYLAELYRSGSIPEGFAMMPENWSADQIKVFQKYWDALLSGNLADRRKLRFLPALKSLEFPKLEVEATSMDEMLVRVLCFFFNISPQPFVRMLSRNVAQNQQETASSEGLKPTLDFITETMNEVIQSPQYMNHPDHEFVWQQSLSLDPEKQALVDKTRTSCGLDLINELRDRDGKTPLPGGGVPGTITATGFVPLTAYADRQAAAEKAAANGNQDDDQLGNQSKDDAAKLAKGTDSKKNF